MEEGEGGETERGKKRREIDEAPPPDEVPDVLLDRGACLRLYGRLVWIAGIVKNLAGVSHDGVMLGQPDWSIGVRAMPDPLEDAGVDFRLRNRDFIENCVLQRSLSLCGPYW